MRAYVRAAVTMTAIGATLGFATVARAAPTTITGGGEQEYSYKAQAAPGTVNAFTASVQAAPGGFEYVFSDSAGLVTPLYLSCRAPDGSDASMGVHPSLICAAPSDSGGPASFTKKLTVEMGDGDDQVNVSFGIPQFNFVVQIVKGDEGNDNLAASGPAGAGDSFDAPLIEGGPGNDVLRSGGDHKVKGGTGIDRIFARNGVRNRKINCQGGSDKREKATRDRKDPKAKSC
jgi:hypothetical protein